MRAARPSPLGRSPSARLQIPVATVDTDHRPRRAITGLPRQPQPPQPCAAPPIVWWMAEGALSRSGVRLAVQRRKLAEPFRVSFVCRSQKSLILRNCASAVPVAGRNSGRFRRLRGCEDPSQEPHQPPVENQAPPWLERTVRLDVRLSRSSLCDSHQRSGSSNLFSSDAKLPLSSTGSAPRRRSVSSCRCAAVAELPGLRSTWSRAPVVPSSISGCRSRRIANARHRPWPWASGGASHPEGASASAGDHAERSAARWHCALVSFGVPLRGHGHLWACRSTAQCASS